MFWQVVCNSKKTSEKILNGISCTFGVNFFCCIWTNALNNSFIYNCTCQAWPFFRKTEKMSWTKHVSHAIAWCGFFKSTRVRLQKYLDYSTSTNKKVFITTSSSSLSSLFYFLTNCYGMKQIFPSKRSISYRKTVLLQFQFLNTHTDEILMINRYFYSKS